MVTYSFSNNGCVYSCDTINVLRSFSFNNMSIKVAFPVSSSTPNISSKNNRLILVFDILLINLRIASRVAALTLASSPADKAVILIVNPLSIIAMLILSPANTKFNWNLPEDKSTRYSFMLSCKSFTKKSILKLIRPFVENTVFNTFKFLLLFSSTDACVFTSF